MINIKRAKKYCCEDISKIENYGKAIADETQTWQCHHRAEILPCGRFSILDLKQYDLYFSQPADRLIFLTQATHTSLHSKDYKKIKALHDAWRGKHHSSKTKKKMSERAKGRLMSENARRKMSEAHKGKSPSNKRSDLRAHAIDILDARKAGTSVSELAKIYNCSERLLYGIIKSLNKH